MTVRRYLLNTADNMKRDAMKTGEGENQRSGFWDRVHQQDLLLAAVMLVLMVLLQSGARADTGPVPEERYASLSEVGTGSMLANSGQGYQSLLRLGSEMSLIVSGLVVQATVTQRFQNTSNDWLEATYVFPLPSDSAVNEMRIRIGERLIEGVIKEKQRAKQLFVKAKREGKQAGLMEQQRANLFTTRVANIPPGEAIDVEFQYLQRLQYQAGEFSLRLPLTLTPRYIPGRPTGGLRANGWSFPTDQVPDAPEITPPQISRLADNRSHHAQLQISLAPGFDLAEVNSPFHDVRVQRDADTYHITPRQNPVIMNRDFVIRWRPVASQAPTAAVFLENKTMADESSSTRHALLMLMPPEQAFDDVIPPRELLVIIDTSGSMSGTAIAQAKAAVLLALERLRPGDRFNLIEFNSGHRLLFASPQPAEHAVLQQARQFVQSLHANGGTEMYGALEAAFATPVTERYLRQVVFITDGSVGNEHALLELIHQRLGNSRLYTVGIGSAPNEFFMRKAAEFGKGTFAMIGSQQQVQQEMSALFDRIEKPVMTDLAVTLPHGEAEWFPEQIPDLYAQQPLMIYGRFDQWPESIQVSGRFSGQAWRETLTVHEPDGKKQQAPGVATLWAREKVQALEDESTRKGNRDLRRDAILGIGLDYGIVTRFTSFVAIARQVVRDPEDPLKRHSVPNLMPEGSTQKPPSVGMPQTALGIHHQLILGLLSLLAAAVIAWLKYGCHFSAIVFPSTVFPSTLFLSTKESRS